MVGGEDVTVDRVKDALLGEFQGDKDLVAKFIHSLYEQYVALYFTYLEINPLVITGGKVSNQSWAFSVFLKFFQ